MLTCLVLYLAGCTSMRYLSSEEIHELEQGSSVWVTMADGSHYEMKEAKTEGSKLAGYIEGEGYREIDFAEIESLSTREPDAGKTALLAVAGIAGVILSLVLYDAVFCDT